MKLPRIKNGLPFEAPDHFQNAVADLAPAAEVRAAKIAKLNMLGGDELIQLSLKPAIWFIPLMSLRVVVVALGIGIVWAAGMSAGMTAGAAWPFHLLLLLVAGRLGLATLQWASRLYVLTNRRVLRFKGVFNVCADECWLMRISAVTVSAEWYEKLVGIGTVRVHPCEDERHPLAWRGVAHPEEIRDLLTAAIRKAQRGGNA